MQLSAQPRAGLVRSRIGAAACALLAAGSPALARADSTGTTTLDASGLVYGEQGRARVVEPTVRVTRTLAGGQSFSGQFALDVITGASPSGALPSGSVQTVTTASGRSSRTTAGEVPTSNFQDTRFAFDGDWTTPLARYLTATLGGHFSREKDYQSSGVNGRFSLDLLQRLVTVTAGGGINHDGVFPVGGTPAGLSDGGTIVSNASNPKNVTTGLLGISRVLTRRWLAGLDYSHTLERGFLTEPYKVVSIVDASTGVPSGQLTENRPSRRSRSDLLVSSVYHFTDDVLHLSFRYYWDDWGVKSSTLDAKYRTDLPQDMYIEPHLRYYSQTQADFFTFGMVSGQPVPAYATSDYRLGALRTATVGATFGFKIPDSPGEWSVRAEYIRQYGDGYPASAIGVQRQYNLFPAVNIGSAVVNYTIDF